MVLGSDTAALVHSARNNDARAWEEIVARFRGLVASIARSHGLRADDIADVMQTTWLRLYESIDRLRDPERLAGWISTTARRECLRLLRTRARELPADDAMVDQESHAFPAPDLQLVTAEEHAVLWSAVHDLPDKHHDLMTLLLASPRPSYADISRSLDMAIGSIGPTRMRAIEHLRKRPEVAALAS
jgi:RNA polymerase sigma factor (sigma-70 family)